MSTYEQDIPQAMLPSKSIMLRTCGWQCCVEGCDVDVCSLRMVRNMVGYSASRSFCRHTKPTKRRAEICQRAIGHVALRITIVFQSSRDYRTSSISAVAGRRVKAAALTTLGAGANARLGTSCRSRCVCPVMGLSSQLWRILARSVNLAVRFFRCAQVNNAARFSMLR